MPSAEDLRVLVADDHSLYRRNLVRALDGTDDLEVVAEASTGEQAVAAGYLLKETPAAEIGESARRVARGHSFVSPELAGRLLEEFGSLARRASAAINGDPRPSLLSSTEVQVLQTMAQGAGYDAIAAATGLTEPAVRDHVRNILEKLHLATRTEAVLYAVRTRLIDP